MDDGKKNNVELFSQDEIARIEKAVAESEKKTEGEIIPLIVSVSDAYPAASLRLGIFIAGVLAAFATYFLPSFFGSLTFAIWFFPLLIVGTFLAPHFGFLRFFALSDVEVDKETFERAVFEFSHARVHETKDGTGILIFVSLFEHRVIVLADAAINAKVASNTWDQIVAKLVVAIKQKRMAAGLEEAVTECGKILSEHFPAQKENLNQLPNRLIIK